MLALGRLITLFGFLVPPLLNLGTTNLLTTSRLQEQRSTVYAADGTTDGAIQYLRSHPTCGRRFQLQTGTGSCPTYTGPDTSNFSATVDGRTAITTVTGIGALSDLDRTVTLSTSIGGQVLVTAKAIIRDSQVVGTVTEPPVDVQNWTYVR